MRKSTGELAQRLRHQPGLKADMTVAHLTFDLGPGHESGHRVDDDDIDRAGPDEHVRDLQCLLTGIGLGDQQRVGVDPELGRVVGVECVLGVDEGCDPAGGLGVRDRVQSDGRLAGRFRTVDLHYASSWQPADAERHIQRDGTGRDDLDRWTGFVTEPHNRALAELLVDLCESVLQRLLTVESCHGSHSRLRSSSLGHVGDGRGQVRQFRAPGQICGQPNGRG